MDYRARTEQKEGLCLKILIKQKIYLLLTSLNWNFSIYSGSDKFNSLQKKIEPHWAQRKIRKINKSNINIGEIDFLD
jgi:hypothetical protein